VIVESESIYAQVSGTLKVTKQKIVINWENEETREYLIPAASNLIVSEGDFVESGAPLTSGPKSPQQILAIQDINHVQQYLIEEVQNVYLSQGVTINDKHIEVIVSQMLRKVRVNTQGDTDYIPGELIVINEFENKNDEIMAEGGEPATATPALLGITRASLNMDSFLAAASFQETTRVLTEAATNGQVDELRGLKENVIIGRLIPARFDQTEAGRKKLGLDELDTDLNLLETIGSDVEESDNLE
jgi:DNA-directed RNA polymerase subunit beta'